MKTTLTLVACTLFAACASAALGQQTYPASFANPPMPNVRFAADNGNVSAFGAQAQQAISNELQQGAAYGGGCGCGGCGGGCGCGSGCCEPSCGCGNSGCCGCACNDCDHCCAAKCCYGCCLHRTGVFGEWLYLTPRNIDLAYGVPQNGIGGPGTVPQGDVGVANLDYSTGFRLGASLAIDCTSSIVTSFTWYDTDTTDAIAVNAPNVIQPLTMFPGTFNAGFTAQVAAAAYDIEYQFIDVDYKAVLWSCNRAWVNYSVGARYAHMESQYRGVFPFAPPDGTTFVGTDINFDGAGLRFGLEGERRVFRRSGLSVYSKGYVSALAGRFGNSYNQTNQFNGLEAQVGWDDDRVITITELEAGLGWQNCCGNIRVAVGYYFAWWNNVITTPEWINSVQGVNFTNVGHDRYDQITFDGLVVRSEFLF